MPRVAVPVSPAVARLLRERRQELGLSLREVQDRLGSRGHPVHFTTLRKIERGEFDPGVTRLHQLLKVYDLPLQLASDLLDLEETAAEPPREAPSAELYAAAKRYWEAGDIRQALAHFLAVRSRVPDDEAGRVERQRALLAFSSAASSLGKHRLAREIVDGLLVEPPDPSLLVPVLVRAAGCWHQLGSGEAALAFLTRAEVHVQADDHANVAWIHHARASTLVTLGRGEEASTELGRALAAYRRAGDDYGYGRALGVRVRLHSTAGDFSVARTAAREAREHAEQHGQERLATMHRMHEGYCLVRLGGTSEGITMLTQALSRALAAQDTLTQFYAHFYLWRAYEDSGNPARAAVELKAAQYFVDFVDEESPEVRTVRGTRR